VYAPMSRWVELSIDDNKAAALSNEVRVPNLPNINMSGKELEIPMSFSSLATLCPCSDMIVYGEQLAYHNW